jgi:prepilin-type N-terminal cleavage/methylation domain-containing protein
MSMHTPPLQAGSESKDHRSGFTLIELLAVVTVIAILVSLLLPAMGKAKAKAEGIYCMNNNKQLLIAWSQYTDENDGTLLFASADGDNPRTLAATWVNGYMDNDPSNRSNYDINVDIKKSPLWRYAPAASIWKCPADRSKVRVNGRLHPRVRSMAMSIWVGGFGGKVPALLTDRFRVYLKMSDAIEPGPSQTWLLLDQREDSVNWGNYFTAMHGWPDDPASYRFITDVPASYHHRAGGISFMDGHAEVRRWRDQRTMFPVQGRIPVNHVLKSPDNQDIAWLQERATRPK